jgi:hypothetical protein
MGIWGRIAKLRDELSKGEPHDVLRRGLWIIASVTLVWVVVEIVQLAYVKAYAIDEYLYVHLAWLASRGEELAITAAKGFGIVQPILFAPFTYLGGDNPDSMIYVRLAALIFLGVTAWAFGRVVGQLVGGNRRLWGLLAILLLFTIPRFVWHCIEVRPDGIAVMFLMLSLLALYSDRLHYRWSAALGGAALACAALTSPKAIVIGSVFFLVFLWDLWSWRKGRPMVLRCCIIFAASFAAIFGAFLLMLLIAGRLPEYVNSMVHGAASHEKYMPGFSSYRYFDPFFANNWPMMVMAGVGVAGGLGTVIRSVRQNGHPDRVILPLLLLLSAWASFFAQKSAYAYSLVHGIAFSALFAALALVSVARMLRAAGLENWRRALVSMLAAAIVLIWSVHRWSIPLRKNERQRELLSLLHELVPPGDAVWDMSAAYVFRPHAHRYLFIDNARKKRDGKMLEREVPEAILKSEATLVIWDIRLEGWRKAPVGRWVQEHFQRFNNDFYIWGKRYGKRSEASSSGDFDAIKTGKYFVHPPSVLESGILKVDGQSISSQVFELEKGKHSVTIEGFTEQFYLLWLPANGQPFDPHAKHPRYELARFVLP